MIPFPYKPPPESPSNCCDCPPLIRPIRQFGSVPFECKCPKCGKGVVGRNAQDAIKKWNQIQHGVSETDAALSPSPAETSKEHSSRLKKTRTIPKRRKDAGRSGDNRSMKIPKLISIRVVPREGPLFYGMQLTAYFGKFDDGSERLLAHTAYELDGVVQVASTRARKGYKFEFARSGYRHQFRLSERDKKNVISIVNISDDFIVPGL
jgi:hypothetical protein